jgi:tRNA-uridine 2-sulfurtransferase
MVDKNKKYRGHAVALFSGGLDSALAILLMLRQNIRVTALTFMTHFGCDISDRSSCGGNPYPVSEKFGFDVKLMHLGDKFVEIVKKPKYGYGKNMNPCIDCRILMLREARTFMDLVGADFIITGEVLGQRPKSQMRNSMNTVIRDSELKGRLVRPLSAKLLDETIPEKEGLLDREMLEDISGRSRRRQMELAEEFGLEDYPSPAAGCLLTDPSYSRRLKDLIEHSPAIDFNDLNLLRVGRHFRISDTTKVVVGRNEQDNDKIRQYAKKEHFVLEALGTGSPLTLLITSNGDNSIREAASLTARYCGKRKEPEVEITCINEGDGRKFTVAPADEAIVDKYILR